MTKKEFDDLYFGKVVHCDTEEKAREFLALAHSVGYRWFSDKSLLEKNEWDCYEEETCYHITNHGLMYANTNHFNSSRCLIIEYQPQLKFKVGDKVRVKDTQSFYIDGKIGVIEKVNVLAGLPYFVNIYGDGWLWVMAEENLEKVEEPTYKETIEEIKTKLNQINILLNKLKRGRI